MGLFALAIVLALAGSAQAAPVTTVSFTFDDGRPSQMAAEQELVSRGMNATFFIITAQVGQPGVMTLADLNALKADGMEIGAHTVLHPNLPTLSSDEAKRELCLSRNWLMDRGFDVYDMAYPYDSTSASIEQSVAACGYNSARAGGQLLCDANHACAETTPPLDAYSLRAPNDFNASTTFAQMKAAVVNAESHGGGWVPLELHDVCDGDGDPLLPAGAHCTAPYFITRALYRQFLDWLADEVDAGRVQVKTVHGVIGGTLQPQVAMDPAPLRTGNLLLNPSFEQAGTGGLPSDCWANISNGPGSPPTIATTSDAHSGSKALAISVPATYDSWAYNLIAPPLDLAQCSPTAVAGHRYTFSGWYKGNGQIKVVAYWRNADNLWARLDWGAPGTATFPAAAAWTKAAFTFQAPTGATAVSAGFYVDGTAVNRTSGNSYTIDDTSLVDQGPPPSTLTVSAAGSGNGTVTSNPAGIACGAMCQAAFANGSAVTLTAVASSGSSFTGWSGACSGASSACSVSMSVARSVTATFTLLPVQLGVAKAGSGSGAVTSSPAGIDCGATCQAGFTNGSTVTLTAVAAPGSTFVGWSGACTGTSPTCALDMTADRIVTAAFAADPTLTVLKAGTGNGTVSSGPAGIACGAACGEQHATYAPGTTVTLTAIAADGSAFTGWSDASCGDTVSCTVSLDAARTVTATFTANPSAPTSSSDAGAVVALPEVAPTVAQAAVAPASAVAAAAVRARPAPLTRPKVGGSARVGRTLVCTRGRWTGSPSRYVLTWRRDGKVVASGSSYRVRKADRGHSVRCDVTAANAKGASTAASGAVRVPR